MNDIEELRMAVREQLSHLSQRKIADQVGYSATTISQWLNGKYPGKNDRIEARLRAWIGEQADQLDKNLGYILWYAGDTLYLIRRGNLPWVPIEPLCSLLGADPHSQATRLRRHAALGRLTLHRIQAEEIAWTLIPLSELQWFLRTLRPRTEEALRKRDQYLSGLVGTLFEQWFVRLHNVINGRLIESYRKPDLTADDANTMLEMRRAGSSYSDIANHTGTSNGTVQRLLDGDKVLTQPFKSIGRHASAPEQSFWIKQLPVE